MTFEVPAWLAGFGMLYTPVGLIGAGLKLPNWPLFSPRIALLGLKCCMNRHLAERPTRR